MQVITVERPSCYWATAWWVFEFILPWESLLGPLCVAQFYSSLVRSHHHFQRAIDSQHNLQQDDDCLPVTDRLNVDANHSVKTKQEDPRRSWRKMSEFITFSGHWWPQSDRAKYSRRSKWSTQYIDIWCLDGLGSMGQWSAAVEKIMFESGHVFHFFRTCPLVLSILSILSFCPFCHFVHFV